MERQVRGEFLNLFKKTNKVKSLELEKHLKLG